MTNLWAEIEVLREAQQRKRAEAAASRSASLHSGEGEGGENARPNKTVIDTAAAQASVAAAGQKAGAYISSWGSWAADKRKGWGRMSSMSNLRDSIGGGSKSPTKKEEKGGDGIGRIDA